jgi:hypothetical protein
MLSLSDDQLDCVLQAAATLPVEMRAYYLVALAMASRVTQTQHLCLLAERLAKSHRALADALSCSEGDHLGDSDMVATLAR